jgi:hypothetical protein
VTGQNSLTITLSNLLANPKDASQTLSDLSFTTNNAIGRAGISAQVSTSIGNITNKPGGYKLSPPGEAVFEWTFSAAKTTVTLDGERDQPFIIGPPDMNNSYSNANNTITGAGSGAFLDQSATFVITGTNLTRATMITSVMFSFGSNSTNVAGQAIPEPSSLILGSWALALLSTIGLYRSRPGGRGGAN